MKIAYSPPGSESSQAATAIDLAYRAFNNPKFVFAWMLALLMILVFVSFPLQRVLLVFWAYGPRGLFQPGHSRVAWQPIRFSDGVRVPQELDILTGLGMFTLTTLGLSFALYHAPRRYDRVIAKPQTPDPR